MGEGKCFLYFLTSFGRIKSDEQQRCRFNFGRKEEKEEPPKLYHFCFLSFNLTVGSLIYTLLSAGNWNIVEGANQIWNAIRGCNPWYLVLVLSLVIITYLIDGLIIYVFARLYTRRYHYYQGVCTSAIGAFYNNVSPANTGGQVMQVFTLKSQGIEVSNGASIMVMWFILTKPL